LHIIVAITGSTGVIYGIRFLETLKKTKHKSHLIISNWGENNIKVETNYTINQVKSLATYNYNFNNLGSSLASGSNPCEAMVVIPCSMKTLSAIAHGYTDNLISRAADVTLKEKRKLIIIPRETPLSLIHLENMTIIARSGGIILPPMPAFYCLPKSIDDIINYTIIKILKLLNIENNFFNKYHGLKM